MRQQLELNKLLGITKTGDLVLVDYLFSDSMHGQPFHGATGSSFRGVTQSEIDERNDLDSIIEDYGYLWEEAVKAGCTTESQRDYMEQLVEAELINGECAFWGHDPSYIHYIPDSIKKVHFDGCETFECVGGGRMFPIRRDDLLLIFDEDLFQAVEAIEQFDQPLEVFQELLGGELKVRG